MNSKSPEAFRTISEVVTILFISCFLIYTNILAFSSMLILIGTVSFIYYLLFTSKSESRFLSVRDAGKRMRYGRYMILPKILYSHGLWSSELIIKPLIEFTRRER